MNSGSTTTGAVAKLDGQLSDLKLRFLDLFRQLNTADCNCRHVESFESKHRSNALLQTAMILLHHVVQVFTGPNPDATTHAPSRFQFTNSPMRSGIPVQRD